MPLKHGPTDRFPDATDWNPDTPERQPDASPFCGHVPVHHQVLPNGIRSWACQCGWWRFITLEGVVEEQDRGMWKAWRQ